MMMTRQKNCTIFYAIAVSNVQPFLSFDNFIKFNTNWHHISYRFAVIAAYCSNFGHLAFFNLLGAYG